MKAAIGYPRELDQRKSNRYWLSAPVRFTWLSRDGLPQKGEGSTRDINISGVYVLADPPPPIGALLQLDIMLPNLQDNAPGMHLYGEGKVLRRESRGANDPGAIESGFAASVQFYPETAESDLSRFERSEQMFECAIYEHGPTIRRLFLACVAVIRKRKYLSLPSLAAQSIVIAGPASTVCR